MGDSLTIEIVPGELLAEFGDLRSMWRAAQNGEFEFANDQLLVDAAGRLCPSMNQLARAVREATFPVRVFRQQID